MNKELEYLQEVKMNLMLAWCKVTERIFVIEYLQPKLIPRDELHYTADDFKNGHRAPKEII